MSVSKILSAALVGALTFSSGAFAKSRRTVAAPPLGNGNAPQVYKSKAKCAVVATGYSEVSNKKAIAAVSADAYAYICNEGETGKSAHSIATATAEAFALAVAGASATCEAQGNASFKVAASSSAKAAADVWVKAYASAFASAGDCDKCNAYAGSFGYLEKEVFLKAVAKAEVKLEGYTTGSSSKLLLSVLDYQAELKKVVVTAFAQALAGAAKLKKADGCLAWSNAGGCIYTPEHPDTTRPSCGGDNIAEFECTATAVSVGAIEEIDACASASASAAAWTCGKSVAIADLEVTAMALAEATAVAISYAYASCEEDGAVYACAYAGTYIEETAFAVAYSYASVWASAVRCKDRCSVEVDAVAEAVGSILVKAATSAYVDVCAKGGRWTVEQLAIDIQRECLCALAEASAIAISVPGACLAGGIVYADASHSICPAH